MTRPEFECCWVCIGCGETYCSQVHDSPGEADRLCEPCWETTDERTEDELLAAHDALGFERWSA